LIYIYIYIISMFFSKMFRALVVHDVSRAQQKKTPSCPIGVYPY